jgi:hypothetical protein
MRFLTFLLVLICVAAVGFGQDAGLLSADHVSSKRGASGNGHEAPLLKAGWYYSWYIDPGKPVDAEFVPMIAHGKDANSWYYDRIMALKSQGKVKCLLGFNEPERKAPGGDISVDKAIDAWPLFEKTGLRLGSPAPAFDDAGRKWLDAFMTRAAEKKLRVDFICLHWYGDVADPQAAAKFAGWLNGIHQKYNKPVWITEFAGLNWGWLHHPITEEMNEKFIAELEPQMEKTKWIERYCWFSSKPANLFDDDQRTKLSRLGEIYRDGSK